MDTYSLLRHFADSWALLAMFGIFVGICLLTLSRRRALHEDAANAIFRHDTPAGDDTQTERLRP